MDRQIPLEIWSRILTFACTADTNTTANSLCLVSRFFYDACKTLRFRNLTLTRTREVFKLNNAILARPPRERAIRNLVVGLPSLWNLTSDEENQSDYIPSDSEGDSSNSSEGDEFDEEDGEGNTNQSRTVIVEGGDKGESSGNQNALLERRELEEDIAYLSATKHLGSISASDFPPFDYLDLPDEIRFTEDAILNELGTALKSVSSTLQHLTLVADFAPRDHFPLPFTFPFSALTHLILGGRLGDLPEPKLLDGSSVILFPVLVALCIDERLKAQTNYHNIGILAPRLEYLHIPYDRKLLYTGNKKPSPLEGFSPSCTVILMDLQADELDVWRRFEGSMRVKAGSRIKFRLREGMYDEEVLVDAAIVGRRHEECG